MNNLPFINKLSIALNIAIYLFFIFSGFESVIPYYIYLGLNAFSFLYHFILIMKEKRTLTQKIGKGMQNVGLFMNKHADKIAIVLMVSVLMCSFVFATDKAETLWVQIRDLIQKWIVRLGAVIMLIGGIMFGVGWMSDDPSRKTSGINVVIAGAIVTAVAALTGTFMA